MTVSDRVCRSPRTCRLSLAVVLVGVGWLAALPAPAAPARAASVTTAAATAGIVNFDAAGHQVTRDDTGGDAVDAHDGDLAVVGGLYYLCGQRYGWGYALGVA